ncbi:MAG: hybrid sensor histidine kinase/response regulator [Methylococcaceae bacterium]
MMTLMSQNAERKPAGFELENQTVEAYSMAIEHYADQAAAGSYYGLQDVCLLIVEALQTLPQGSLAGSKPDLLPVLHVLPALIGLYYQGSREAIGSIVEILRHPDLSIALVDDELAMLEASLAEAIALENDGAENQNFEAHSRTIEYCADQAAAGGYYGLQDVCLLIVEALQTLPQGSLTDLKPDLLKVLQDLPALISGYCQGSREAIGSIVEILRHPNLSIALADDEFAMLEASLAEGIAAENDAHNDDDKEEIVAVTQPLSREALELVELLAMEAEIITGFLQDVAVGNRESVENCLEQTSDELERYANVSQIAGFQGLVQICEHVSANIKQFRQEINDFTGDKLDLLCVWISNVKQYLATFNDSDAGQTLVAQLADNNWPLPLTLEAGAAILTAIRASATSVCSQPEETRKHFADSEDVSLSLPDDVNRELLDILLQELPIQTQQFSESVQRIQAGGSLQDLDVAQRVAHTIKGSANTVGIKGIAVLTHHLEDILVVLARENRMPGNALANVLIDAADCLEGMSESLMGFGEAPSESLTVLQEVLDWANRIDQSGIGDIDVQESDGQEYESIENQQHAEQNNAAPITSQTAMVRVPNDQIEHLFRLSGESTIVNGQANERLRRLKNQLQAMDTQFALLRALGDELEQLIDLKDLSGQLAGNAGAGFDALEMDQYNELHTASRRMVEAAVDAREMNLDARKELELMGEALDDQQRLVIDTQGAIMQMRLVPVFSIVPRLQRALRQTCRLTRKQGELMVLGEQLLIDGDTLNSMVDPLMHLLRNAVDHGIESEDQRLAQGKSSHGNICIEFDREGNKILVRCRDDGRGLDFGAIRAAAERRGVIQPGQTVSEDELKRFILRPNFSTRTQSTQISGRGVGMDAVHFQVINLGGTLALHSVPGRGLTVELRMPLPLSRSHALLAQTGTYRVAIASKGLLQILYSGSGELITVDDEQLLQLGNDSYPVISLNKLLNIPDQRKQTRGHGAVLLVQNDDKITAVLLDAITDSLDIVIKNLGYYIKKIPGFMGGAIIGDGTVVPVLDIPELLRTATYVTGYDFESIEAVETSSLLPAVLVVDDSLSQRRALEQILQDAGFHVRTARDGIEAAEILAGFKPDIVLTDLEMPRMNGIELTSHIRARAGFKTLPVIMITSRTTQKHRKMAEDAGVNFYLVKPVREDDLLEKIQSLIEDTVT